MVEETVADLGEFGLIARVNKGRIQPAHTLLGPGDDAAVVAAADGKVVVSTDVLIEGVHFRQDWSSADQVGRKAAAVSMADVAAMGAAPTALLVGLGCPPHTPAALADGLAAGLWAEAGAAGAGVVGGDVVCALTVVLSVTVLGSLEGRAPVTRAGARPGDVLALAGRIGWSAAGLAVLSAGAVERPGAAEWADAAERTVAAGTGGAAGRNDGQAEPAAAVHAAVSAHLVPEPPYPAGPAAARAGATAMIDLSDGLLADVGHVMAASEVAVDIRSAALPVPAAMAEVAALLGTDPMRWLLTGGEDHALVATFPPDVALPAGWTPIGLVGAGSGLTVDGVEHDGSAGWDHFSGG